MLRLLSRVPFRGLSSRTFSNNIVEEDLDKKRQILELEIDLYRQEGKKVPSKLTETEWARLLDLPSVSARRKYYSFLFSNEMHNINLKKKKEARALEREERLAKLKELEAEQHIVYGLGKNSIFLKIYETTMNLWQNNKLVQAMQFEPKLVIDCSYDEHMTQIEADNCAKQLVFTFASNRIHNQPFDLHFCNFDVNSRSGSKVARHIPTLFNLDFPMNVHAESYLDVFDKKDLVYLTPHCRNELIEYNPNDVYIVGAMVDKAHSEPLSLARAKKYGLRMAKFPLDRYYTFQGGKCLTINQVADILLEMKVSNDWKKALSQAVPKRKIGAEITELDFEEKMQKEIKKDIFKKKFDNREKGHFNKFTKNIKIYNSKRK